MAKEIDYTQEEKRIAEAILKARSIQEYIWADLSYSNKPYTYNSESWINAFQKRVDKIELIDFSKPSYKVELRKRILQQAALSIAALVLLDTKG